MQVYTSCTVRECVCVTQFFLSGVSNSGTRNNGSQVKEEGNHHYYHVQMLFHCFADKCPICLSGFTDSVKTKCGHVFCRGCIDQAMQHNSFCPTCKTVLKTIVGNQPDGRMDVQVEFVILKMFILDAFYT